MLLGLTEFGDVREHGFLKFALEEFRSELVGSSSASVAEDAHFARATPCHWPIRAHFVPHATQNSA